MAGSVAMFVLTGHAIIYLDIIIKVSFILRPLLVYQHVM